MIQKLTVTGYLSLTQNQTEQLCTQVLKLSKIYHHLQE